MGGITINKNNDSTTTLNPITQDLARKRPTTRTPWRTMQRDHEEVQFTQQC